MEQTITNEMALQVLNGLEVVAVENDGEDFYVLIESNQTNYDALVSVGLV